LQCAIERGSQFPDNLLNLRLYHAESVTAMRAHPSRIGFRTETEQGVNDRRRKFA
jgi:hypothetical protein